MKNEYIFKEDYVIGKTRKGFEFLFDAEDYDMISKYYWRVDSSRYAWTIIGEDNKHTRMHKLLLKSTICIHINGNNSDNRKSNLSPHYKDGKVISNGYVTIYNPTHHKAFDNGCVYEHVAVAESMLNRDLKDCEHVHHKDKNRKNNSEDNLMVFATNSDHIKFHAGSEAMLQDDGAYICI